MAVSHSFGNKRRMNGAPLFVVVRTESRSPSGMTGKKSKDNNKQLLVRAFVVPTLSAQNAERMGHPQIGGGCGRLKPNSIYMLAVCTIGRLRQ